MGLAANGYVGNGVYNRLNGNGWNDNAVFAVAATVMSGSVGGEIRPQVQNPAEYSWTRGLGSPSGKGNMGPNSRAIVDQEWFQDTIAANATIARDFVSRFFHRLTSSGDCGGAGSSGYITPR